MSSEPLVSIITPAFNAEYTIKQTLESVLAQTYQTWELLVVDDASTDTTAAIVYDFEKKDNRIQLLRLDTNTGSPAKAKNAVLPLVKGDLVAFLDADDLWLPSKLEIQVDRITSSDAALCYTGGWYVDDKLVSQGEFMPRYREGWLFNHLLAQYEINNQSVLVKHSAILALTEPCFNTQIVIGEDCDLFMRIASRNKLLALPDKLVQYRVRNNSISATSLEHAHEGLEEVIRWTEADTALASQCGHSLRVAHAKVRYYKAKAAMERGEWKQAQALLFPVMFVGWKFSVLALATLAPPIWRFCLRFGHR